MALGQPSGTLGGSPKGRWPSLPYVPGATYARYTDSLCFPGQTQLLWHAGHQENAFFWWLGLRPLRPRLILGDHRVESSSLGSFPHLLPGEGIQE